MNSQNKWYELSSIHGCRGNYTAVLYNRCCGYYKQVRFLDYSKKAMYRKLRNEFDCVIPRTFH